MDDMYSRYPILVSIMAITSSFVEELVFRYTLRTVFKNKIVFIVVSSVIFGLLHGIGVATLLYVLIGVFLAVIYLKTDENIAACTICNLINNLHGIILAVI